MRTGPLKIYLLVFVYFLNGCDGSKSDPPVCGDGIVQAGEECDDGNQENRDQCTSFCKKAVCGDGITQIDVEECDDGNDRDTDGCPTNCQIAKCGDGFVWNTQELCDDGDTDNTDQCTNECKPAQCGDGYIQDGEACDDGNDLDSDDCLANCIAARCGDGQLHIGVEQCDDGNDVDSDGCRNDCTLPSCGDGIVDAGEECDDGNISETDACLSTCLKARCGDGFVQEGIESCDDGNKDEGDDCRCDCSLARCGDGIVRIGVEECDDGNMSDTDACLSTCVQSRCGDGIIQAGVEACDDGNDEEGDDCRNDCTLARCGDGIVHIDVEECDDGNAVDTDECRNNCALPACGDGVVQAGEECDDGNDVDADACNNCQIAVCGDGVIHANPDPPPMVGGPGMDGVLPNEWIREESGPALSLGLPGQWDDTHIVSPAVIKQQDQFVMYYIGSRNSVDNRLYGLGRATSLDGVRFTRQPAEPVYLHPDGLSVLSPAFLRNPDGSVLMENGQFRLWVILQDLTVPGSVGTLHYIQSPDGLNWSPPSPPQLANIYAPTIIKEDGVYHMWYVDNSIGNWVIRYATSDDGEAWNVFPDPVIAVDQAWERRQENFSRVFYPYVVRVDDQYVMWYAAYRADEPVLSTAIGVATSPDGANWTKSEDNPVITPEPDNCWESHYNSSQSVLRLEDGGWRIWYASRKAPPYRNKYFAISTATTTVVP